MKSLTAILLLLGSFLTIAAQSKPPAAIFAETAAPVLNDRSGAGINFALSEDEYRKLMKQLAAQPNFIEIKEKPAKLSAEARFGINLVVGGKNIGWILDGSDARGFTLYADWNADGDPNNDPKIELEKTDGKYKRLFSKELTETVDGEKRKYRYEVLIEVAMIAPPGATAEKRAVKFYDSAARRGALNTGDLRVAFELTGAAGLYDTQYNNLYFDLNGDGKFETRAYSPEKYKVSEKYINLGGVSYEFSVDRYGDRLTLKPLAEKLPPRSDLSAGSVAPEISFRDLDGTARRLSDFRGRVVLLDFWGLWCAPCVAEAPKLAAVYQKLKAKGFEILSFDKGDTIENLRKFTGRIGMNWTHSQMDDALARLYRVDRYPTYFLLDQEGRIVSNEMRPGEELYRKIEEMLEK